MRIDKILVTGRLYNLMEKSLENISLNHQIRFLPENELTKDVFLWADAFVGFKPTPDFVFGNLKWVHSLSAGVDSFLLNKKWKKDVLLTRTIGNFGQKISEYCLSYILADIQLHRLYHQNQQSKVWKQLSSRALKDQKILIVGTGEIGQAVTKNLYNLGSTVTGVSLNGLNKPFFTDVVTPDKLFDLLPQTNWLINTLPLTHNTENFFNQNIFTLLDNACFINVGRGATVDEGALINALDKENLRLAIMDVFRDEPLSKDSVLWNRTDVIITPHVSAMTDLSEAVESFIETLKIIDNNEMPLFNKIDIEKGY